ncbi:hypothetical protein OM204_24825, partial [Escherichia albertii]|nr:hypothetical protein [Escherichia albertii]
LAIRGASRKWAMPLRGWRMEMSRFIIEFGDRLDGHFREKAFTQNPEQARVQLRFTTSQGGGCFPSGVSGMRVYG